jgi:hypothetical protein
VVLGCGGSASPTGSVAASPFPADPFNPGVRVGRFHSTRFGLSIALPDGPRWRIDDHHSALLRATHAPTHSKVELVSWREAELVNRQKCEERAREKGYGERAGTEVTSEVAAVPTADWDTEVWLSTDDATQSQVGPQRAAPVTGHLFAFASNIRRCLYFHFSTEAAPPVVSDRLAYVRLRILGDLRLDSFDIPRERMDLPNSRSGNEK